MKSYSADSSGTDITPLSLSKQYITSENSSNIIVNENTKKLTLHKLIKDI